MFYSMLKMLSCLQCGSCTVDSREKNPEQKMSLEVHKSIAGSGITQNYTQIPFWVFFFFWGGGEISFTLLESLQQGIQAQHQNLKV